MLAATSLLISQRQAAISGAPANSTDAFAALVPAWMVIFVSLITFALGYCVARLY